MPVLSRRHFLQQSALGATGLLTTRYLGKAFAATPAGGDLQGLAQSLTATWGKTLLGLQVTDKNSPHYGTLIYPPENSIHGRMGECIYPFLHLASRFNDSAYVDAAVLLYNWMEKTVSQDDGSWLNEPEKGSWKGTTVFGAIALGEAVKQHGHLLDNPFKQTILQRLQKAGDFIYNTFNIDYGNINYPIASTYGLSLLGELLDVPKYKEKARTMAHEALRFLTPKDGLLSGEGGPYYTPSAKGCFSVDLGYNVEESLPNLVLYSLLTKDDEVLEAVQQTMQTHLQFMLPDGGWDNSWGTRNYKWTYWGSRTSDGCQPAYALLGDRSPEFYKAATANTQLLQRLTHNGLLYGGPHYLSHGVAPSLHHTFCHIKALTTILDHGIPTPPATFAPVKLPREQTYGSKFFADIQTGLVAKGPFRATVTAYDRNYKDFKGGHASGGALSMLWHEKAGPVLVASMNEYQLYEAHNMQEDKDPHSMPLTPRIQLMDNGIAYTNSNDFGATMQLEEKGDTIVVRTTSALVNKDQQPPASGMVHCQVDYHFSADTVTLHFRHDAAAGRGVQVILPVISAATEAYSVKGQSVRIHRNGGRLQLQASKTLRLLPATGKRIFNYVPGFEALPFYSDAADLQVAIRFWATSRAMH